MIEKTVRRRLSAIGGCAIVLGLCGLVSGFAYQTQTVTVDPVATVAVDSTRPAGRDGQRDGIGIADLANGNTYTGELRNGIPHGRGRFATPDGGYHEGEWRNGVADGIGVAQWSNGARYQGEWRAGRLHGLGSFVFANGNRYDGEWRDTRMSGRGRGTWPDGASYDGEWLDDWPHGQGTYVSKGVAYTGLWIGGCLKADGQIIAIGRPSTACRLR